MNTLKKYSVILMAILVTGLLFSSCKDFLNPDQELALTEDDMFTDWYEYRSAELGMYSIQQDLVEQLVILGELRGDLLTVTPNADEDLVEIYNFNISKDNKYASPTNFFKLISASNNFIRALKRNHPEVADPSVKTTTNYDKLYGEALCMRAWAYFNAVRIYGKVPYIEESLVTLEEIEAFVNSPGEYIDSVYIDFARDGYYNDTIYNKPIKLDKQLLDMNMVLDMFINQLEKDVKAVGVNHYIENNDNTWELSVWNTWAYHTLLGNLYLYQGNLVKASQHYEKVIYNSSYTDIGVRRYELDNAFSNTNWKNIYSGIDNREHIFTLWFKKANFQQNDFQRLFEPWAPHEYMLKPTRASVMKWETTWRGGILSENLENPKMSRMTSRGNPMDQHRGYGKSYLYVKGNDTLTYSEVIQMLVDKADGNTRSVSAVMEGYDTIVYKYSLNKKLYDEDINFIVYRAAAVHLNLAEVYNHWAYLQGGVVKTFTANAVNLLNDGSNYSILSNRPQLGVRGRVGLAGSNDRVNLNNFDYQHDPFTNQIIGYRDLTGNLTAKQRLLDEKINDERALELAYEGERFYDLMRVAKRWKDPAYLATKVAEKYPAGKKEQIYNYLLDEDNWYIHFFD